MAQPLSPIRLQRSVSDGSLGNNSLTKAWHALAGFCLLALLLITTGCGGGGGGNSGTAGAQPSGNSPQTSTGELIVSITDAEGDFVSYLVEVVSLTLHRANGDTVETLPFTTAIDFTELTEVTELLTIASVPEGTYESVVVRLDFSDAEIIVQNEDGEALAVTAVGEDGAPLAEVDVRLNLTTTDVIRIAAGRPAAFSLDFDLDASNTIDLAAAQVIVEPFLLATPELETDREHRVRGVLKSVELAESEFDLRVRPFRHRTGQFGEFTVAIDEETQFEVDGEGLTGQAGLEAMASLDDAAPVVSSGVISMAGMAADIVLAGSSVPWSDADVVIGVVTARAGDVLTVRGGHVLFADGRRAFRGEFAVTLTDDTTITAPGVDNANLSKMSVSVGQRVVAWGEFSDDVSLVAQRVRMRMNQVTAEVLTPQPMTLDLFHFNGRLPGVFDFSGTGVSPTEDADPDNYEVDTGALGLSTIEAGDLVRVRGLVNEFGMAPADYLARSVIDVQTDFRAALLQAGWTEGTAQPFSRIDPAAIEVDLSEARKALSVRGVPSEFIDELESVVLAASDNGRGVFAVAVRGAGEMHIYRGFSDLVDELVAQLDAGRLLHRISAKGGYNVAEQTLTTKRAGFVFSEPVPEE
ncbi:MAG: DUF4382 domain-containing protein [Pseudomonadales bacterium]|nr:DUF4382 domain-containing protein [Pseudomonadales bacterium]